MFLTSQDKFAGCKWQHFLVLIPNSIFFQINDQGLDHLESLDDALKLLNTLGPILTMTLAKSCNQINNIIPGPLSSSSSGHNMQDQGLQDIRYGFT